MTERFKKATDALYKGFFNGTLAKGTCSACAVGNIVCDAMGGNIEKVKIAEYVISFRSNINNHFWSELFKTFNKNSRLIGYNSSNPEIISLVEKLQSLTGYSVQEMSEIEYVFETNTKIHFISYVNRTEQEILEDQYNGLCAVFDVLMQFDEIGESSYKEKLKTHPKLQLC